MDSRQKELLPAPAGPASSLPPRQAEPPLPPDVTGSSFLAPGPCKFTEAAQASQNNMARGSPQPALETSERYLLCGLAGLQYREGNLNLLRAEASLPTARPTRSPKAKRSCQFPPQSTVSPARPPEQHTHTQWGCKAWAGEGTV